jgi:hypothetical protein
MAFQRSISFFLACVVLALVTSTVGEYFASFLFFSLSPVRTDTHLRIKYGWGRDLRIVRVYFVDARRCMAGTKPVASNDL